MGQIYQNSAMDHVFLGQNLDEGCLTATDLRYITSCLPGEVSDGFVLTKEALDEYGLPQENIVLWKKMQKIFESPWFQRLSVIQEAALAKDLLFHLDDDVVSLEDMVDFADRLHKCNIFIHLRCRKEH